MTPPDQGRHDVQNQAGRHIDKCWSMRLERVMNRSGYWQSGRKRAAGYAGSFRSRYAVRHVVIIVAGVPGMLNDDTHYDDV